MYSYINLSYLYKHTGIRKIYIVVDSMYRNMAELNKPLLTYSCSISVQGKHEDGSPKTFSIFAGNLGGFSSNVLKRMPPSKVAGRYQMVYDPENQTLTIRFPK